MTYTFKTFGPQPDGTYRYKVYNGPMGIAPRTVQEPKRGGGCCTCLHCQRSGRKGGFQIHRTMMPNGFGLDNGPASPTLEQRV